MGGHSDIHYMSIVFDIGVFDNGVQQLKSVRNGFTVVDLDCACGNNGLVAMYKTQTKD